MAEIKPIVQTLCDVRDWFDEEVCSRVQFKKPSNTYMDNSYKYELVKPNAFAMVTPTSDMMSDGKTPAPSVTIRLRQDQAYQSKDDLQHGTRSLNLIALFETWSPGLHGEDWISKSGHVYARASGKTFQQNAEGWKDAWNFVDTALIKIESADYIGGLMVDQTKGIAFSAVGEDYPFWYAQITFTLTAPLTMSHNELSDFL